MGGRSSHAGQHRDYDEDGYESRSSRSRFSDEYDDRDEVTHGAGRRL